MCAGSEFLCERMAAATVITHLESEVVTQTHRIRDRLCPPHVYYGDCQYFQGDQPRLGASVQMLMNEWIDEEAWQLQDRKSRLVGPFCTFSSKSQDPDIHRFSVGRAQWFVCRHWKPLYRDWFYEMIADMPLTRVVLLWLLTQLICLRSKHSHPSAQKPSIHSCHGSHGLGLFFAPHRPRRRRPTTTH